MKKRILSLLCAAALVLGLAGCTISSSPDTVGTIGETSISSGMYLLSQYQGYFSALEAANAEPLPEGETRPDYAAMPVKKFLKETLTIDGAEVLASDYVAAQTLKNVQYYAAVDTAFAALNGELSPEALAQADADAQSIWDNGKELYQKNGFSLHTVQQYQYTMHKADALLQLVYGKDGTKAASDDELLAHLDEDLYYVHTALVPLYNTQNFQITDDSTAKVKELGQAMMDRFEAGKATAESAYELFYQEMKDSLPAAFEAVGNTFTEELALGVDLLDNNAFETYFSTESADKVRNLAVGDAVMIDDSGFAVEFYQRVDPVAAGEWNETLRQQVLYAVYGEQLQAELLEYGASLENGLDTAAMQKLPASKIIPALD